ncbi:sugar phosphate isomerase/epimerase [Galbibacter sp. BG1]|uniref:sugar phosphate isomerase/epimerase family protein n=1 Tax=Galbibacter sp. BG1 TaxID=1170699 RepID=UPI0015BE099C|nr:sugar phosphate isomerase/epimerase [Galbibacter sp. BG1]QLE01963.1 sugar phosphate isomerase/epimerase [Galbibacter sp. BG1]
MRILYYYPIWSIMEMPLEDALSKIKNKGYDGAEYTVELSTDFEGIPQLFKDKGLKLLAQHPLATGNDFEDYKKDYIQRLNRILSLNPTHINCHTGKDYFTFEENLSLLEAAENCVKGKDFLLTHEIHRGRFSFNPTTLSKYLERSPSLKLTADFSHWCVVSESLLENHSTFLDKAIENSYHIHARVGNEEAPQVNHPFAPEHGEALNSHLTWWQSIVDSAKERGVEELPITCEFGPAPYLPTLPYTNKPVASIWDINFEMMQFLKENLKV